MKELQYSGHWAIAGGGCLHLSKEYSGGKMLKHIKNKAGRKKKLLIGEFRKSGFSSEVFPSLLSEERQIQTNLTSDYSCIPS